MLNTSTKDHVLLTKHTTALKCIENDMAHRVIFQLSVKIVEIRITLNNSAINTSLMCIVGNIH